MSKVTLVLLAVAGIALSVPANADGVYAGAGPVRVGLSDGHHRDGDRVEQTRTYVHSRDYTSARHCRVKIIQRGDHVTRVRRCD
jgi:hypothetical protein